MMNSYVSLQIVWTWISVLTLWAEWANVTWTVVHQAMADHLVLALEALAAFRTRAACDGAVVWSALAVDVLMRAVGGALAFWS